ncbi:MAG: AMP-binding protein [Bacteroidota bacterium]
MKILRLHSCFKLNNKSFLNKDELLDYTKLNLPEIYTFLKEWFDASDFVTVKTSGSTGKPKQIQLKKEYMMNSALATGKFFNLPDKTTALLCMPLKFIAGKMMLVRALVLGWHLDVIEATTNPLKNVDRKYDFSAMVPLQLYNSLDNIHWIKKIIIGGGAVSDDLISKIKTIPTEVYASYGMTETITHIAVKPLNVAAGFTDKNNFFKTLPDVEISKDHRDCLVIDAIRVSNNQIITNDLVDIISSNEFEWIGRFDNIINSGGIKLIPEKIEQKLSNFISQRFFITGLPDDVLGEKAVLLIEGSNLKIDLDRFKSILAKYEVPKEVYFIDNFVETVTKKIQRQKTLDLIKL